MILYAVPVFLLCIGLEAWLLRERRDLRGYEARDTAASLAMGLGNVILAAGGKVAAVALWSGLHRFALFDLGREAWVWLLLIPCEDFCYYWFHRLHHEVRLLWAAHENHHSSRHYNLSTALRQSWTTPFTGPLFWAPLALLGFDPIMIGTAQAISLVYQFWIHTEGIGRIGPLEWILNTPSHHRVHHGRNVRYLDRNHAGILIVWDRLFGTFEPESERADFGLTRNIATFDPVRIAFHEWYDLLRDVWNASSPREAAAFALRPPGWSPDGRSLTSTQLRQRSSLSDAG